MKLRVRIDLDEITIKQANEGSGDEPFVWPIYVIADGSGINLADPKSSTLKISMPSGSHGNVTAQSDLPTGTRRTVPAAVGSFEGEIDTLVLDLARSRAADACLVAVAVIALEEDNTADGTIEDARRAALKQLRTELNKAYGKLVADALGGAPISGEEAARRLKAIDLQGILDAVIGEVMDQVVPGVVAGILVNPLFLAFAVDQDDFVGYATRHANLRQLVAAGPEGMSFSTTTDAHGKGDGGRYQVRGRIRAPDLGSPPTLALTFGAGGRLDLFARAADRRVHHARRTTGAAFSKFSAIGSGVFLGAPAATMSESNSVLRVFGLGNDRHLWSAASGNGGDSWQLAWGQIDNFGVFTSAPAACAGSDGRSICLAAIGNDKRCWHAVSTDAGTRWQRAWTPIGEGVFSSAPALACSADAKRIYAVGRGNDNRCWLAVSADFGATWVSWMPIGEGKFKGAPAIACSADGRTVHVFGVGLDDQIWHARSRDGAASWELAWATIQPGSVFIGAPAAACSLDGSRVALAAVGWDLRAWWSMLNNFGAGVESSFVPVDQALYLM